MYLKIKSKGLLSERANEDRPVLSLSPAGLQALPGRMGLILVLILFLQCSVQCLVTEMFVKMK